MSISKNKKIIHIDMDCFYAAIEMRDDPTLQKRPIAVGGASDRRGVLCTANYMARQYGVHSAMATAHALKLCPDLVVLPVNMDKYKSESQKIRSIFKNYTSTIEPLSLDEAYLDVSNSALCEGSATLIAKKIRQEIFDHLKITASAGIAANKFLAKIASDWNKPNNQFTIPPESVDQFMIDLPVGKIWGVGKVTEKKLLMLGIQTCGQLQQFSISQLIHHFGGFGIKLYHLSRGEDDRSVTPRQPPKSLSVESTYSQDLIDETSCLSKLPELMAELEKRIQRKTLPSMKSQFVKLKFSDFETTTAECASHQLSFKNFETLCQRAFSRHKKSVRLVGLGIRFQSTEKEAIQLELPY